MRPPATLPNARHRACCHDLSGLLAKRSPIRLPVDLLPADNPRPGIQRLPMPVRERGSTREATHPSEASRRLGDGVPKHRAGSRSADRGPTGMEQEDHHRRPRAQPVRRLHPSLLHERRGRSTSDREHPFNETRPASQRRGTARSRPARSDHAASRGLNLPASYIAVTRCGEAHPFRRPGACEQRSASAFPAKAEISRSWVPRRHDAMLFANVRQKRWSSWRPGLTTTRRLSSPTPTAIDPQPTNRRTRRGSPGHRSGRGHHCRLSARPRPWAVGCGREPDEDPDDAQP